MYFYLREQYKSNFIMQNWSRASQRFSRLCKVACEVVAKCSCVNIARNIFPVATRSKNPNRPEDIGKIVSVAVKSPYIRE